MRKTNLILVLACCGLAGLRAETGYKLTGRYAIGGTEGWDYVSIDSAGRRLYVSHGTRVDVLDADTGKAVGVIPDTPGVHGIAVARAVGRGFTSNGQEDKVSMFDLQTLRLIQKIDVGKGPDGIYYDAGSKRVFTNNHGSHDITAIDPATGKVVGTVKVEGDGEQAIVAANGQIFVNLEDKAEVVAFDPKTLEVKRRFPIAVGQTPTGLAYDGKTNRLFIGLRNEPKMAVMDAATGKVVTSLPIGPGVDFAAFDPSASLVFFSCGGDGTIRVFHEKSADAYEDAGSISTQPSAKTMAFDAKTRNIFLPAAEVLVTPASEPGGRPKRTIKEGSFAVLVVSKN
jgi:DNA-binding beta-propeller fold protein YncE